MKKHTAQITMRFEPEDYEKLQARARYRDVPVAVAAREMMLSKLYEELAQLEDEFCAYRDDARGSMLRGMQIIKARRVAHEDGTACA